VLQARGCQCCFDSKGRQLAFISDENHEREWIEGKLRAFTQNMLILEPQDKGQRDCFRIFHIKALDH
jgi:hypothetical protein